MAVQRRSRRLHRRRLFFHHFFFSPTARMLHVGNRRCVHITCSSYPARGKQPLSPHNSSYAARGKQALCPHNSSYAAREEQALCPHNSSCAASRNRRWVHITARMLHVGNKRCVHKTARMLHVGNRRCVHILFTGRAQSGDRGAAWLYTVYVRNNIKFYCDTSLPECWGWYSFIEVLRECRCT